MKGIPLKEGELGAVSKACKIDPALLWALMTIEGEAFGFLEDRRPKILFERHVFSRLTNGAYDMRAPAISNQLPGVYGLKRDQYPRLEAAITFNRQAALQSASWGLGQVMGFNFQVVGYSSVDKMVSDFMKSEMKQLQAVAVFLNEKKLLTPLRKQDWKFFAEHYNGPQYAKSKYDERLAAQYESCRRLMPDFRIRTAQVCLTYLGFHPGIVDGIPGRITDGAVTAYQELRGLSATGLLDDTTERRLLDEAI